MSDVSIIELRRLDLTLLLVFDEALRSRRLSAVAEKLGLTPSAVSHAVNRLRDIFGDPLFLRRPHGVEPTPRALGLEAPVQAALEALRTALAPAAPFDPTAAVRTFRIGAPDHEATLFAPDLIGERAAPGLSYIFRPFTRQAALQALREGEIDLALGFLRGRPDGLSAVTLYEEGYAVVLRRGHPAAAAPLDLAAYTREAHVLVSPAGDLRGVVDDRLEDLGLVRRVAGATPYFMSALATVARTDLLATVPARLAQAQAAAFGLEVREPPLAIRSFPVQAAWSRRGDLDPGLQWLIARLKALTQA